MTDKCRCTINSKYYESRCGWRIERSHWSDSFKYCPICGKELEINHTILGAPVEVVCQMIQECIDYDCKTPGAGGLCEQAINPTKYCHFYQVLDKVVPKIVRG